MRRFFVKNILFVIALNIIVKPVWFFFIDRTVQNRVPGGDYGTYQALLSLSIIFQMVLDFGITNYNSREIAGNPDKLHTLFPSMITARLVLIMVYMVFTLGCGYAFGYRGWEMQLLAGVLGIQALNTLSGFMRSNVAALQRFKTDGILSITDRLLMVGICGFLLYYPATAGRFRIGWFVVTQCFCYLTTVVASYLVLRRIAGLRFKLSFNSKDIFKVMKASLPYALLIFQMSIYNRADAMLIERLSANGKEQAGIFAAAFRILDMVNMVGLMFATMLLPLYGRMIAEKLSVQPIVKLCVNMMLPLSMAVSVICIFFGNDIMKLLYKGAEGNAHDYRMVFSWLIASFPAWCMMYVYSTLLTARGDLKLLNILAFCGVVLNLTLNLVLIPRFHATGGAATSFVTQTGLAIAFVIFAKKKEGLPFNIKWMGAQAGYMMLITGLAYAMVHYLAFNWIAELGVFMGICIGLLFLFKFVSLASIKQLAQKEG